MINSIKHALMFFLGVSAPITLLNAISLFYAGSCDPKFGCWGTFQLLTLIAACLSFITSFAAGLSHYLLLQNRGWHISKKKRIIALMFAFTLSLSGHYAVALMEAINIVGTVFLYFFVTLAIHSLMLSSKKI